MNTTKRPSPEIDAAVEVSSEKSPLGVRLRMSIRGSWITDKSGHSVWASSGRRFNRVDRMRAIWPSENVERQPLGAYDM